MTTRDDDDRDLDAFLGGEDDLSALLRGLPQEAPSKELDARILAQARAALAGSAPLDEAAPSSLPAAANDPAEPMAAPPAEALDSAEDDEAPRPSNPFGHLRVPMAIAATLVVGVSLALQLGDWRAPANLHDDAAPAGQSASPNRAAEQGGAAAPAPVDSRARSAAPAVQGEDASPAPTPTRASAPARAPASAHARARPAESAAENAAGEPVAAPPPPQQPAITARPAPEVPAMTWPAPAPAFAPPPDAIQRRVAPTPVAPPAPPSAFARSVEIDRAPPAPSAPPAPTVAAKPSTAVQVAGSRIGASDAQEPDAWLARIGSLLDQHRDDDARAAWLAFRRAYPEAAVPDALRARIEALPPAP